MGSKSISQLLKLWEEEGLHLEDPEGYERLKEKARQESLGVTPAALKLSAHKEAELVLLSLSNPSMAVTVECPSCKDKFQTNYAYQRYCSTTCLQSALESKGLKWDPYKSPEERWKGEPPSVITPTTFRVLQKWAQRILSVSPNEKAEQVDSPSLAGHSSTEHTSNERQDQRSAAMLALDQLLANF